MQAGKDTSEFLFAKGAGAWANVALILGVITAFGSQFVETFGATSQIGVIAGGVVALAGICMKTFTSLGYIKSRTSVKEAAAWEVKEQNKDKGTCGYAREVE